MHQNSLANLKRGGTNLGAGRPKKSVREQYLHGADVAASFLVAVAQGKAVVDGENGKKRKPTFTERMVAIDRCLRYGLGTEDRREVDLTESPAHKVYLDFDPVCCGMGDATPEEIRAEAERTYISVVDADGGILRFPKR